MVDDVRKTKVGDDIEWFDILLEAWLPVKVIKVAPSTHGQHVTIRYADDNGHLERTYWCDFNGNGYDGWADPLGFQPNADTIRQYGRLRLRRPT